jgi:hypothetical protein
VKKFFPVAAAVISAYIFLSAAAFADEFDGFRDMRWGQELSTLKAMQFLNELDGIRYYKKLNDEMYIGDAGVHEIAYAFESGRLAGVIVSAKGEDNARLIFETLKIAFSTPFKQDSNNYYWKSEKARVFYNYEPHSKNLYVSYLTEPILGRTRRARHY